MLSLKTFIYLGLCGGAMAAPKPGPPEQMIDSFPVNAGCGEVNVFYTGFTAYHPYVAAQGLPVPLSEVDRDLRTDTANLVKAGYNVRVLFQGPEEPVSRIGQRMKGTKWHVTGQGFGVRGFRNGTATARFEDNLFEFHKASPFTPTVFNWGANTLAESVIRRIPLRESCVENPGKLIAYEEVCSTSLCEKVTNVLNGSLDDLLKDL